MTLLLNRELVSRVKLMSG